MASVNKREWTYKGQIKTAWVVRYFDVKGAHRQKTFERKKDADAFLTKVKADELAGNLIVPAGLETVDKAVEYYLRFQEQRFRDGRIGQGRYTVIRCSMVYSIKPIFGRRRIDELTVPIVEAGYQEMAKGIQPRTARNRIGEFAAMLDFLGKRKLARGNPASDALKDMKGIATEPIRTFRPEEVLTVLKAADERPKGYRHKSFAALRIAVHLATFCGLRWGEIFGLTVESVDLDQRFVRVRHSITRWGLLKGPKTPSGNRDVPMPEHVAEMLREYLAAYYVDNDRGLIFTHTNTSDVRPGKHFQPSNFHSYMWVPLLKRAGLYVEGGNNLHFHALRHFAASWMIENRMALTDVASLLGHRSFDVTLQVYAHPITGGHRRLEMVDGMTRRLFEQEQPQLPGPQ